MGWLGGRKGRGVLAPHPSVRWFVAKALNLSSPGGDIFVKAYCNDGSRPSVWGRAPPEQHGNDAENSPILRGAAGVQREREDSDGTTMVVQSPDVEGVK